MNISPSLDECRAVRIPRQGLAALAPLRRLRGIEVIELGGEAWVAWKGEMPSIVRALLPMAGVRFFRQHENNWRPIDSALPDFAVPLQGAGQPLDRAVVPAPLSAQAPPDFKGKRVSVTLVPCLQARPTTAMRTTLNALLLWCERATTFEIRQLRGAVGIHRIWLRGEKLPVLSEGERFWGNRLLVPLGMRPDPEWPENSLRLAAAIDDDEILVLTPEGPEALPVAAFQPLTRAAVRRMKMG